MNKDFRLHGQMIAPVQENSGCDIFPNEVNQDAPWEEMVLWKANSFYEGPRPAERSHLPFKFFFTCFPTKEDAIEYRTRHAFYSTIKGDPYKTNLETELSKARVAGADAVIISAGSGQIIDIYEVPHGDPR